MDTVRNRIVDLKESPKLITMQVRFILKNIVLIATERRRFDQHSMKIDG